MPMIDRAGSDTTKVTASLVRDARSLLRRADKLVSAVAAIDDSAANEVRDAVDRLVHELVSVQQRAQRSARDAIRKAR